MHQEWSLHALPDKFKERTLNHLISPIFLSFRKLFRIARCEKMEADTEQPIAAPSWPSYGTHLPLRNLCILRTVCAVVSRFRGRHRALCAGRGVLGRFFGLRDAARPRTWRYAIAHGIRDKVHVTIPGSPAAHACVSASL